MNKVKKCRKITRYLKLKKGIIYGWGNNSK